jgi:hypothetical protein
MTSTFNVCKGKDRARGSAAPEIAYCREKNRLLDEFLAAVHELNAIQAQQVWAVIEDDPEFSRFDVLLHLAQERKDRAKYAWIDHVEEHHCGGTAL